MGDDDGKLSQRQSSRTRRDKHLTLTVNCTLPSDCAFFGFQIIQARCRTMFNECANCSTELFDSCSQPTTASLTRRLKIRRGRSLVQTVCYYTISVLVVLLLLLRCALVNELQLRAASQLIRSYLELIRQPLSGKDGLKRRDHSQCSLGRLSLLSAD